MTKQEPAIKKKTLGKKCVQHKTRGEQKYLTERLANMDGTGQKVNEQLIIC